MDIRNFVFIVVVSSLCITALPARLPPAKAKNVVKLQTEDESKMSNEHIFDMALEELIAHGEREQRIQIFQSESEDESSEFGKAKRRSSEENLSKIVAAIKNSRKILDEDEEKSEEESDVEDDEEEDDGVPVINIPLGDIMQKIAQGMGQGRGHQQSDEDEEDDESFEVPKRKKRIRRSSDESDEVKRSKKSHFVESSE